MRGGAGGEGRERRGTNVKGRGGEEREGKGRDENGRGGQGRGGEAVGRGGGGEGVCIVSFVRTAVVKGLPSELTAVHDLPGVKPILPPLPCNSGIFGTYNRLEDLRTRLTVPSWAPRDTCF